MQPQSAEPSVSPEVLTLLQTGVGRRKPQRLRPGDRCVSQGRRISTPAAGIVFFRLGDAYMKKHDYAGAISPLKRAAELSPDSLAVHQLLGYALLAEGYASQAIPHLKMIHDYGALGIAQLQAGQPAEAVDESASGACQESPDDPDLLFYLSRAATSLSGAVLDRLLSVFRVTARGYQALGQN